MATASQRAGFPFEMASDCMLVARSQSNQLSSLPSNWNVRDNGFIGP